MSCTAKAAAVSFPNIRPSSIGCFQADTIAGCGISSKAMQRPSTPLWRFSKSGPISTGHNTFITRLMRLLKHTTLDPTQVERFSRITQLEHAIGMARKKRTASKLPTRMTISKPHLVRLLAAVLAAAVSAGFVVLYTRYSEFRFEFEHPGGTLMNMNSALSAYGHWLFALPVLTLAAGWWLLVARPAATTSFEIVVSVTWLLAFTVALFCILAWQTQNVPSFSHMEWHY